MTQTTAIVPFRATVLKRADGRSFDADLSNAVMYVRDPADQAVEMTRIDQRSYRESVIDAPVVPEMVERVSSVAKWEHEPVARMHRDAYGLFVKTRPVIKQPEDVADPLALEVASRVVNDDRYHELHQYTTMDDVASLLAGCSVVESVVGALSDELKKRAAEAEEKRERLRELEQERQAMGDGADGDELDEMDQKIGEAQHQHAQALQQFEQAVRQNGQKIKQAVATAVGKAADNGAAEKALGRMAGMQNGQSPVVDPTKRLAMAQQAGRIPRLKQIVDLAGRIMQDAVDKRASRASSETGEIVDIELGSDPARLMLSDVALMSDPDLGSLVQASLFLGNAMMYEVHQKQPMNKGEIVVLLDESGSMQGERDEQAKGLVLAIVARARQQGRRVVVHTFQYEVTSTTEFMGKGDERNEFVKLASRGASGGTSFRGPFLEALRTVERLGKDRTDVLIVTDGDAQAGDDVVKRVKAMRERTGMHVYAMMVGQSNLSIDVETDRTWIINDLLRSGIGADFINVL